MAGCRRLWALIRTLPSTAAVWRRQWTQQDELLASLIEVTDAWGRAFVTVNGGKPSGRPLRIERPGEREERERLASDPEHVRRVLAGFLKRR